MRRGKGIGGVSVAIPGWRNHAKMWNESVTKDPESLQALQKYGGEGLSRAARDVARDMMKYINDQLNKRGAAFNSGKRLNFTRSV